MNHHRPFVPGGDAQQLVGFSCSTGAPFEDEVENWINDDAVAWLNDVPYATFQRKNLHLVESDAGDIVAVFAWQDIVRIDVDGLWLEVVAVAVAHQHGGVGRQVLADAKAHLATVERDGDVIAGLVHPDNQRSRDMLLADNWVRVGELDGHDLMMGHV